MPVQPKINGAFYAGKDAKEVGQRMLAEETSAARTTAFFLFSYAEEDDGVFGKLLQIDIVAWM